MDMGREDHKPTKGVPISRRCVFAGLGLLVASPALALLPAPVRATTYDAYVLGVSDTEYSNGITFTQKYYYKVGSKILPGRGRQVHIYKTFYQSRGWMDFTTRDEIYCNGAHVCTIPRREGSWRGPQTLYKNDPDTVGFIVYGGGLKRITTKEVEEVGGTAITSGLSFDFTIPWYIEASCTSGGTISSKGTSSIEPGGSKEYSAKPVEGYKIASLEVDGSNVGARTSYTFSNVNADHTIHASFARIVYTVTFKEGYGQNRTLKTEKVAHGDPAHAPEAPKRDDHRFTGWDKDFSRITNDLTVTAKWRPLAKFVYHADGEARYTQGELEPGTPHVIPSAAVDSCRRLDCSPGWKGWFTDEGCTRPYSPDLVPEGTTKLYSYNELTVGFAPTTDCAPTTGTFVTAPGGPRIDYPLIPSPRTVRYGHGISLSLPNGCMRDDGDSTYVTYRPQGYFPSASGGTPSLSLNPKQDTTIFIRWVETIAEGVETTL